MMIVRRSEERRVDLNARRRTDQKMNRQAVKMTRLSCHRFRANEVRLWLSLIAYNLGNLWRRLVVADADQQLVADQLAAAAGETGGGLIKRARYC